MSRRDGERGSTMIEAALILSLLMALLVGMVEAGRQMLAWNFVSYAAREAIRFAEVRGAASPQPATPESIEKYVKALALGVDPAAIRVTTQWLPDSTRGSRVRVLVSAGGHSAASEAIILN